MKVNKRGVSIMNEREKIIRLEVYFRRFAIGFSF